jgi:DNA end-binding protein Ku
MRYEDEVRAAQSYFREIPSDKPDKALLDLATTLIEQRTAPFEPGEFHDRYIDALKSLIDKKQKARGKKILEDVEEPADARGSNVIDLMAALKKSVGGKSPAGAKKAPARQGPAKKAAPAKRRA